MNAGYVRKLRTWELIIRATWSSGEPQRLCLAELYRRGGWLHDGSNGGDDQQAMAITAAGHGADRLASKETRDATLRELGYGP